MTPPISIDGTDITGATIDGTDVTEITVDGDTVFSAGPDLPPSTVAHFDATLLSLNDGDPVTTWPDQISGNDATDVNPPTFRSSGINGNPAIEFDGTNDEMEANIGAFNQPLTFGIVYKFNDTSATTTILTSKGSDELQFKFRSPDFYEHFLDQGGDSGAFDIPKSPTTSPTISIHSYDFSTGRFRDNATNLSFSTRSFSGNAGNVSLINLTIGNNTFDQRFTGEVSEIMVYDSFLTLTEVQNEETRLSNKYGITI